MSTAIRDPRELPEFSDEFSFCQACHWQDADTKYVAPSGSPLGDRRDQQGNLWPVCAFLKRTCTRCGFQWAERTAEREDAPVDGFCDVLSVGGSKCNERPGHFSQSSPHKFG